MTNNCHFLVRYPNDGIISVLQINAEISNCKNYMWELVQPRHKKTREIKQINFTKYFFLNFFHKI